jgi:uncharacterized protein DUF6498
MAIDTSSSLPTMIRSLGKPSSLLLIAANLVPLVGVLAWGWDAFVLLMLYWLETAVIAFWTVVRVATMSGADLGALNIENAGGRPASPIGLAAFIALHAGIFMFVHFLFLWELFAGEWSQRIHGVGDFVSQMVIGTGLWVPLLVLFLVRGALMLYDGIKPALRRRLGLVAPTPVEQPAPGPGENIIFGLYIRIFIMQVTIIIGAWFALIAGSAGTLAFMIMVKTAVDVWFEALSDRIRAGWRKAQTEAKRQA